MADNAAETITLAEQVREALHDRTTCEHDDRVESLGCCSFCLAKIATNVMSEWLGEQQGAIEAALRERGPWMPSALAHSVLAALRSRIKPTPPISDADRWDELKHSRGE